MGILPNVFQREIDHQNLRNCFEIYLEIIIFIDRSKYYKLQFSIVRIVFHLKLKCSCNSHEKLRFSYILNEV